jgi:cobalt-zinc-cadmium efflux system membrane fusion protein
MTANRISCALVALAVVGGCSASPPTDVTTENATPAATASPEEITAESGLLARIRVESPTWETIGGSQTVAARVDVDQRRVARVGSKVMGRVSDLTAHEGQFVRRGQVLALIESTGLSDAQLAFLKALSNRTLAQHAQARALILLEADVIGTAELQRREADLAQARAELAAARDQLALMGMAGEAIDELERTGRLNSRSRIVATMDGIVLQRLIALGQVVQPADVAFEIADLSSLWLQADVPEQNAGHLRPGTRARAQVAALPDADIEGALSFVSATVNQETRTVLARMELANPHGRYKPAMLATMTLLDQPERQIVVPAAAVVRDGNTESVFVQIDDDTFALRALSLGHEYDGRRVVKSGIREGERVVVEGAFHLNNERRRRLVRGGQDS